MNLYKLFEKLKKNLNKKRFFLSILYPKSFKKTHIINQLGCFLNLFITIYLIIYFIDNQEFK